jgi:periplasmic divalent cation tolerance protein
MQDCNETDILSVTTTLGSLDDAKHLAREILQRRLAACVQIDGGIVSLYHWQGRLCEEPEVRLTIKTLPQCVPALQALFAQSHPYEVPQFLASGMQASPSYAQWARAEVRPPAC